MIFAPNEGKTGTAGAAATEIALDMSPKRQYEIVAKAAIWYRIVKPGEVAAIAAANGDGSHYLPPGVVRLVAAISDRTRVSIIRDGGADTQAMLSEMAAVVAT